MATSLVVFAASAALLQPSVAFEPVNGGECVTSRSTICGAGGGRVIAQMMTCQALADSQMQPVYLVPSSNKYCLWNGYATAYSWSNKGAQHAIWPKS